jgi:hypothetical protein
MIDIADPSEDGDDDEVACVTFVSSCCVSGRSRLG